MNIFYTNKCPVKCAQYLDDKRVVKMCLETAQMLSTCIREMTGDNNPALYKSTHVNHPCNVWVRECQNNYDWLFTHFIALCDEYKLRYNKTHASYTRLYSLFYNYWSKEFMHLEPAITPMANCAANKELGLDFKQVQDTCEAYKLYLAERFKTDKRMPTWYGLPI